MFDFIVEPSSPPVDMVANPKMEMIFTIGVSIAFLAMLVYSLYYWRKNNSPIGVLCIVGGLIASMLEPYCDMIGSLWFPNINTWLPPIFNNWFGVYIPVWVAIGYAMFIGGAPFIAYVILSKIKIITKKSILIIILSIMAFDIILETIGLNMGVYAYYGFQPFQIAKMPWWWSLTGGLMGAGGGAMIYLLKERISGWRSLLVIPLVPGNFMMFIGWIAWPIMIALNLNLGYGVSYTAGVFSILLAWMAYKGICIVLKAE
ncbi:hypothetical protein FACS1894130_10190 [Spirochaetia bacterium]|nr:hypothetical protein FACS1894130_10190 [Spirochaetia bacterium]